MAEKSQFKNSKREDIVKLIKEAISDDYVHKSLLYDIVNNAIWGEQEFENLDCREKYILIVNKLKDVIGEDWIFIFKHGRKRK